MLDPGLAVVFAVFEDTISLGAIIVGILVSVATLVGLGYGVKWKVVAESALALAAARGEALEDAKSREADLQSALETSKEANAQLRTSVEKLEALPNLARILEVMADQSRVQDEAADRRAHDAVAALEGYVGKTLAEHEQKAQERHDQQIAQGKEIVAALRKLNGHADR